MEHVINSNDSYKRVSRAPLDPQYDYDLSCALESGIVQRPVCVSTQDRIPEDSIFASQSQLKLEQQQYCKCIRIREESFRAR
jgi:hypothetical protein